MRLTPDEVIKQIPVLIRNIISANSALSGTGFGPIKSGGIALYCGRWIDQETGRIRLLPTATTKYLNPAVRNQKLGFYEARTLNHWNNLISTQ